MLNVGGGPRIPFPRAVRTQSTSSSHRRPGLRSSDWPGCGPRHRIEHALSLRFALEKGESGRLGRRRHVIGELRGEAFDSRSVRMRDRRDPRWSQLAAYSLLRRVAGRRIESVFAQSPTLGVVAGPCSVTGSRRRPLRPSVEGRGW